MIAVTKKKGSHSKILSASSSTPLNPPFFFSSVFSAPHTSSPCRSTTTPRPKMMGPTFPAQPQSHRASSTLDHTVPLAPRRGRGGSTCCRQCLPCRTCYGPPRARIRLLLAPQQQRRRWCWGWQEVLWIHSPSRAPRRLYFSLGAARQPTRR